MTPYVDPWYKTPMRPYLTRQSYRPHCACCKTKQGHGHPGNSETTLRAQRYGKKAMRQQLKKECRDER